LARQVVEPGEPAWKDIVEYFGKQVLAEDDNLDRKKISKIVFNDFEKRKKLESFTHPRIHEAFIKQIDLITKKNPDAIIQAVIPLLIELNLQYMFHKNILVYITPEQQIGRLSKRDQISGKEAANMLNAQLPIDQKTEYVDFVIKNDETIIKTRKQVEDLLQTLKKIQQEKSKDPL